MNRVFDPVPKGMLVAVGGNEDKEFAKTVLKRIVELPEGGSRTVEIIPTASSIPKEVSEAYIQAFGQLGIQNVHVMHIDSRGDANLDSNVERIRSCDVVFFTGGDQLRITSLLGGSKVHRAIRDHYRNGGVVAGTSAGAACMSSTMIFEGDPTGSMHKGNVQMTPGLGLLKDAVIDTHFIHRGRLSRLIEVVVSNPGIIGLGLGEDTGIIIRDGERVEAFGTGVVVVVDGHGIRYSNISDISLGKPISVENIVVHTLVEGAFYDVRELSFHRPPPPAPPAAAPPPAAPQPPPSSPGP